MVRRPAGRGGSSAGAGRGGASASNSLALCHEWLYGRHGSEKTFEAMARTFPAADLYALTWNRSSELVFGDRPVRTTFLDRLPALRTRRMLQLPLMPLAWRYASRRHHDVVVTSSHACVKGFWPAREALHLCYCYTPMRYLWLSSIDTRRPAIRATAPVERWLRSWDLSSVRWVDEFAAISSVVAQRIEALYGRPSRVLHPPVDTVHYSLPDDGHRTGGFALAVSRMIPYKRLDLAIRASHRVGHPLVLVGTGPEEPALRALAGRLGADVRFVAEPDDRQLRELYRAADVVVFPSEDDFGIVPVEAQACGTPVVALARGGTVDTVMPGITGVLVPEQNEDDFATGMEAVLSGRFLATDCRRSAERFSAAAFEQSFAAWVMGSAAARGIQVDDFRPRESV